MTWLIQLRNTPPGQYYYMAHGKTFGPEANVQTVISALADFRKGNNLQPSDPQSCLVEIVSFTCSRLNNSKDWCYETDHVPVQMNDAGGGCAGCGAQI